MAWLRKGDEVVVISGSDRGVRGAVLAVDQKKNRIKVEKVRVVKKHVKPGPAHPQGGIIEKEAFLDPSNVQLWDPHVNRGSRVGIRLGEGKSRIRYFKRSGEDID